MSTFMATAGKLLQRPLARHRCRRPGARPHRDRRGAAAPGQAQADLHAVHRHRRSRRRRQRGEGQAHRPQGRAEDLPAAQRLRRRPARRARARSCAQQQPGPARRRSGARHAAQDEAGRGDVPQVESVRRCRIIRTRRRNPPSSRSRNVAAAFSITEPAAARHRPPACSSGPAPGPSPSTAAPSKQFFPTEALRTQIRQPLVLTETADKFDVLATVAGGGVSGRPARCGSASRARSSSTTSSCASGSRRTGS